MAAALNAQLYAFTIPALVSTWGVSLGAAGALGSISLLGFSMGPWLMGVVATRIDPVRIARIAIAWFAVFSFASALAQDLQQLLVLRGLMSLGLGTAWAAGVELLSRSCGPRHRAQQLGILATGSAVGWALAALVCVAVVHLLEAALAWRVLFLVGLLPALGVFRWTGQAQGVAVRRAAAATQFLKRPWIRTTLLGALIAAGIHGGCVTVAAWLPAYLLIERGLDASVVAMLVLGVVFGMLVGQATGARIAAAPARGAALWILAGGAMLALLTFGFAPSARSHLLAVSAPLGFFLAGVQRILPVVLGGAFPRHCREPAQAFALNLGRTAGVVAPFLVSRFADRLGLGFSIASFGAGGFALALVLAPFLSSARVRTAPAFLPPTHVNP